MDRRRVYSRTGRPGRLSAQRSTSFFYTLGIPYPPCVYALPPPWVYPPSHHAWYTATIPDYQLLTTIGWPEWACFSIINNDRMAGMGLFLIKQQRSDGRNGPFFDINLNDRMAGMGLLWHILQRSDGRNGPDWAHSTTIGWPEWPCFGHKLQRSDGRNGPVSGTINNDRMAGGSTLGGIINNDRMAGGSTPGRLPTYPPWYMEGTHPGVYTTLYTLGIPALYMSLRYPPGTVQRVPGPSSGYEGGPGLKKGEN